MALTPRATAREGTAEAAPYVATPRWQRRPATVTEPNVGRPFRGADADNSELQLRPKLQLARIEHVARRAEPKRRRRRSSRVIDAAPDRIDVLDVHPVEQVEHVEHQVEPRPAVHRKLPAHPHVHARIRGPRVGVTFYQCRTIRVGVAVEVEV